MNLDFIRLGNKRSVHEEIRPFLADEAAKNIKSIEGLHHFYNQKVLDKKSYVLSFFRIHNKRQCNGK